LATLIASSSVSKALIVTTGPKTSSRQIRAVGGAFSTTVGSTVQLSPSPPVRMVPPSASIPSR